MDIYNITKGDSSDRMDNNIIKQLGLCVTSNTTKGVLILLTYYSTLFHNNNIMPFSFEEILLKFPSKEIYLTGKSVLDIATCKDLNHQVSDYIMALHECSLFGV